MIYILKFKDEKTDEYINAGVFDNLDDIASERKKHDPNNNKEWVTDLFDTMNTIEVD